MIAQLLESQEPAAGGQAVGAEVSAHLTDHRAFDFAWVARHARLVADTRNALSGLTGLGASVIHI